jgi:arylsulfatase A-like enzyme
VCAGLFLASTLAFLVASHAVAGRFAAFASGPYAVAALLSQLRVLPAYLVAALLGAVLVRPLGASRWRAVLLADLGLVVLSLGPCLRRGPGLFDTFARKVPQVDLYALGRWHVLDALTVGFAAVVLLATVWWARRLGRRAWWLLAVAPLGVVLMQSSVPTSARTEGPLNLLVVATDSWRWDRVGVHGAAHADLTPHIDAFSREAIDVDNLHVASASTLESWATLLTGQFPRTHGLRSMYPAREEVRAVEAHAATLPRLLSAQGYDTFVSSDWAGNCFDLVDFGFAHRRVGKVQNFRALLLEFTVRAHPLVALLFSGLSDDAREWLLPGGDALATTARPELLTERLFDQVDQSVRGGRPFFGVLFVSPTHLPYNARAPFNTRYTSPDYTGPNRYQVEVDAHTLITTGFSPVLPDAAREHLRQLYDGAVSDFDATVGQVLAGLEARGLAKNTVVVLTTDHGEDLYEPGSTLGHGTNFFGGDQSTRVPFFVRVPRDGAPWQAGRKVEALARTVDVAPTLLSLLGLPVPASMEGVSLEPVLAGMVDDLGLTAFAETCYLFFPKSQAMTGLSAEERGRVVELAGAADTLEVDGAFDDNLVIRSSYRQAVIDAKDRMVRTQRWKLVELPAKPQPIHRLYDLAADPAQQHDLAGQGLPEEAELASRLDAWWRGADDGRPLLAPAEARELP